MSLKVLTLGANPCWIEKEEKVWIQLVSWGARPVTSHNVYKVESCHVQCVVRFLRKQCRWDVRDHGELTKRFQEWNSLTVLKCLHLRHAIFANRKGNSLFRLINRKCLTILACMVVKLFGFVYQTLGKTNSREKKFSRLINNSGNPFDRPNSAANKRKTKV